MAFTRFVVLATLLACVALSIHAKDDEPEPPTPPAPTPLPFNPCPVCKTAVGMLETQLDVASNLTQTITTTVMQACDMAGPAKPVCQLVMAEYAGLFGYGMSVAKFSMDGFCTGVFMCPAAAKQMLTQNGIFETTCNICKQTMTAILGSMGSEALQAQTQQTIELICSVPLIDKETCKATFGAALAQSMQVTAAVLDPQTFCTMFGPCLVSTVTTPPVPPVKPSPAPPATEMRTASRRAIVE